MKPYELHVTNCNKAVSIYEGSRFITSIVKHNINLTFISCEDMELAGQVYTTIKAIEAKRNKRILDSIISEAEMVEIVEPRQLIAA